MANCKHSISLEILNLLVIAVVLKIPVRVVEPPFWVHTSKLDCNSEVAQSWERFECKGEFIARDESFYHSCSLNVFD